MSRDDKPSQGFFLLFIIFFSFWKLNCDMFMASDPFSFPIGNDGPKFPCDLQLPSLLTHPQESFFFFSPPQVHNLFWYF